MFCSKCGAELAEGSRFCNHCGAAIGAAAHTEDLQDHMKAEESAVENEAAVAAAPALDGRSGRDVGGGELGGAAAARPATRKRIPLLAYLLPVASLLVVAAVLGSLYAYQMSVNRQVEKLRQQGEQLALEGKLAEGKTAIEKALEKRPQHRVLLADRELLTEAIGLQTQLNSVDQQRKSKKFDAAIKAVDELHKQLAGRSGPVFQQLAAAADAKKEEIVVEQVVAGVPAKKTVEELAPLFNTVRDYKSEAAQKAANQIKQKIADIAYDKASAELSDKQFANALSTLDEALKFDESNTKLTTLKKTVKQKKQTFEDAENSRIEQAIEAANQEDLVNRTKAVEVLSVDGYTDERGYFIVTGTIKNRGTRAIGSVLVYIDILDETGEFIHQDSLYVEPEYLDAGSTGEFYAEYDDENAIMRSVSVVDAEWEVE